MAAGTLNPVHVPDLTNTAPAASIGPVPQWRDAEKIVSYRKEHGKFADFEALLKVPTVSAESLTAAKDAIAF